MSAHRGTFRPSLQRLACGTAKLSETNHATVEVEGPEGEDAAGGESMGCGPRDGAGGSRAQLSKIVHAEVSTWARGPAQAS